MDLNKENEEMKEIMANLGSITYSAQFIEKNLAVLVALYYSTKNRPLSKEAFIEEYNNYLKWPLGWLKSEIEKKHKQFLYPDFEKRIFKILKRRNLIIHNYFAHKRNLYKVLNSEGRQYLIKYLQSARAYFFHEVTYINLLVVAFYDFLGHDTRKIKMEIIDAHEKYVGLLRPTKDTYNLKEPL